MHCLHDQGLKPKQNSNCMLTGELFQEESKPRTLVCHFLKSLYLSFTVICSILTDVMTLLLPLCSCQLPNNSLSDWFHSCPEEHSKLPWSSSNSTPLEYPMGVASRSTVGQTSRSQITPTMGKRREQRPATSSSSCNFKKKPQAQTTEPPQQAVMMVTFCLLEIKTLALTTSVGSGLLQSLDDF